jgi:hypothetical protein
MVAAALIGYDDHEGCRWETCELQTIVINHFPYTDT